MIESLKRHKLKSGRLGQNHKPTCESQGCTAAPTVAMWWENVRGEMVSPSADLCAKHAIAVREEADRGHEPTADNHARLRAAWAEAQTNLRNHPTRGAARDKALLASEKVRQTALAAGFANATILNWPDGS